MGTGFAHGCSVLIILSPRPLTGLQDKHLVPRSRRGRRMCQVTGARGWEKKKAKCYLLLLLPVFSLVKFVEAYNLCDFHVDIQYII